MNYLTVFKYEESLIDYDNDSFFTSNLFIQKQHE